MSGNVTLYTAEALCVRRNVVTDKVIPITDTHGIFTALTHLESEQFTKEKIQPALPQQPLGFVSKAVLDKYIRDAADIKELVLSKDYRLVKEYTTQRPGGLGACRMCVWKEFIREARKHAIPPRNYGCLNMPCAEPDSSKKSAHFTLVRIDQKSPGTFKEDEFDFSDWNGIRRASGF